MTHRTRAVLLAACLACLAAPCAAQAQDTASDRSQTSTPVRRVRVNSVTIYLDEDVARRARLAPEELANRSAEEIAEDVRKIYRSDGFSLAKVVVSAFDAATGVLTLDVDEGRFDDIQIAGVNDPARQRVLERLALPTGEVFNADQAARALAEALKDTQGAIVARAQPFDIVMVNGRRVLQIALRAREGTGGVFVGTQGREDWYSPVDAFNAALGVNATIFDRRRFNHTYFSAFVSYKFGPDRAGYSVGLERAFLADGMLQVGGSFHDLTATDDQWRLGDAEQSLVALTFRNTFRDYYRRKGFQVQAALRPLAQHEVIVGWRSEAHSALANETNYGFFRDSQQFRPNLPATPGDLRSLLVGYTFDSRGLGEQRPPERYGRHLLDDLFSEPTGREQGVRIEWRSELAPRSYGQDFDFTRHIATVRGWWEPSSTRMLSGRLMAGTSTGVLPSQRLFALGGIGSVHGYSFKEQAGDRMLLMNTEFRQNLGRHDFGGLVFLDLGHVYNRIDPLSLALQRQTTWMKGVGLGFEFDGGSRIEFGWRLDDIPSSLQVMFRLRPSF